jgi:small subunit ribosomal protein S2
MAPYIYGRKNGIHIINVEKTIEKINEAIPFIKEIAQKNEPILFVGTKKQAQSIIEEEAKRCGAFYVAYKWVGGTLTNFVTIRKNVKRLKELEVFEKELFPKLPREEVMKLSKEKEKLTKLLEGIKEMVRLPSVVIIVDVKKEETAVKEARRKNIPIIGIVDTDSNPEIVDYPIPGNDDAIRSIKFLISIFSNVILENKPKEIEEEIPKEETLIKVPKITEEEEIIEEEISRKLGTFPDEKSK